MRRNNAEQGHNNNERWLLTYADMITLLMAFFIMMYSMSVLNLSKFHQAAVSIRSGFGGVVQGQGKSVLGAGESSSPGLSPGDQRKMTADALQAMKPLMEYVRKDKRVSDSTRISIDRRGIVVSILSDNMLFEPGSAEISKRARGLVDMVAEMLDKTTNNIRIEGYTCNLPPRNRTMYPSNWELSTARATNLLRFLTEQKGLDERRFCVVGYGGLRPIVPNTSEANRRRNRRVDIVVVTDEAPVAPKAKISIPQRLVPRPVDANHVVPRPIVSTDEAPGFREAVRVLEQPRRRAN